MWSFALFDLHLTNEEFYSLTPLQYDALVKRHRRKVESDEFLFAQVTSWIANTGFRTTEKPTQAKEFMPSQWGKSASLATTPKPAAKPTRMTRKRRADVVDALTMLFPRTR